MIQEAQFKKPIPTKKMKKILKKKYSKKNLKKKKFEKFRFELTDPKSPSESIPARKTENLKKTSKKNKKKKK